MLRTLGKTIGGTLAFVCLASSLVMAQGESQKMLCTKDNGKGRCTAAVGSSGKEITVVGDGLKSGAYMNCVDRGTFVDCNPAS